MKDIYRAYCSSEAMAHRSWVDAAYEARAEVRRLKAVVERLTKSLCSKCAAKASRLEDADKIETKDLPKTGGKLDQEKRGG